MSLGCFDQSLMYDLFNMIFVFATMSFVLGYDVYFDYAICISYCLFFGYDISLGYEYNLLVLLLIFPLFKI